MAKKLQVVARGDSFRRAGFEFTSTPTLLDPDKLTKAQIENLKSEPRLVVVEVEVKDEKSAKTETGKKDPADDGKKDAAGDETKTPPDGTTAPKK
ncbi:HI1506-related protein [Micavibrio aeruginosavorus]|uniref:HI1506-related protein n=1 Tax=Micavibrio aeruginosavorus TaxID=349221 RepID=UPI003F4A8660